MKDSTEPGDRIYVKRWGFLSLQKIWVKIQAINMVKNFQIGLKKSTTDAVKTASKRAIQKTAKATGDLIGNKNADKITNVLRKSDAIGGMEAGRASPKDVPKDIKKSQICQTVHQIKHLDLKQKIGLKQMMNQEKCILQVVILSLKIQC